MTDQACDKITVAADIIKTQCEQHGFPVSSDIAILIANELHKLWCERHEVRNLPPGEIAQHYRTRYDPEMDGVPNPERDF